MRKNDIIDLKGIRKFNLNTPEDSLDYLIYLCREQHSNELIDIVIHHCDIDSPNSHFYKTLIEKSDSEKYNICLRRAVILRYWFLDNSSEFTFKDYFYIDSKSDLTKKSKLNTLLKNISTLLLYISTQTGITQFENLGADSEIYFENEFSKKYKSLIIVKQEYDAYEQETKPNAYVASGHVDGLLFFFIGIILLEFYDKLMIDFSGFIDNETKIDLRNVIDEGAKIMEPNSYADVFKSINTYNLFKEYSAKHIIEPFIDYSYLIQRLLLKKLIHKKTHFEYMDWLLKEEFITDKTHTKMKDEGNFRTLRKSSSIQRENNFNNIFEI